MIEKKSKWLLGPGIMVDKSQVVSIQIIHPYTEGEPRYNIEITLRKSLGTRHLVKLTEKEAMSYFRDLCYQVIGGLDMEDLVRLNKRYLVEGD